MMENLIAILIIAFGVVFCLGIACLLIAPSLISILEALKDIFHE